MKIGGIGGANTKTGLVYEGKVDFLSFIKKQPGYTTKGNKVLFLENDVALCFKKDQLYQYLKLRGLDYKSYISKRLLPDNAIYVIVKNTIHIIEVKFQRVTGSVDEKLQTCDFKIKQYRKLFNPLNIEVEYIYILSEWFKKPEYKDVLDYIISINGCSYYFEYLPLKRLGLPVPPLK